MPDDTNPFAEFAPPTDTNPFAEFDPAAPPASPLGAVGQSALTVGAETMQGLGQGLLGVAREVALPKYSTDMMQRARQTVQGWETAPGVFTGQATPWQSGGRVAGGALPFMFQPELGLGELVPAWLARLGEAGFQGGEAAFFQPTEHDTAAEHAKAAAIGAATAGTLGAIGAPRARAGRESVRGTTAGERAADARTATSRGQAAVAEAAGVRDAPLYGYRARRAAASAAGHRAIREAEREPPPPERTREGWRRGDWALRHVGGHEFARAMAQYGVPHSLSWLAFLQFAPRLIQLARRVAGAVPPPVIGTVAGRTFEGEQDQPER